MSASSPTSSSLTTHLYDDLFFDEAVDNGAHKPPYYKGTEFLIDGKIQEYKGKTSKVYSPIYQKNGDRIEIGEAPAFSEPEAIAAVEFASQAYNNGLGYWPQCGVHKRIEVINTYVKGLQSKRDEIVNLLMWEITKTFEDAQKEVDRTIQYIKDTVAELKRLENSQSTFEITQGVVGHIRRAPLGVVLCLGPFNYPFNETYTSLIPALIMGNTVVLKLPNTGVLCHLPTIPLFASIFPPGVVNLVAGRGRVTMPPIMKSGKVDVFAFIGTNSAAASMIKQHPAPNRLRVCLGLDAKNPAIVTKSADIDNAVAEVLLGSLSYNGQRCTALKIIFVHESLIDKFLPKFIKAVDQLKMGLPWITSVKITPLPEPDKPAYLQKVINDAVSKGAKVVNERGNKFDRSFATPTVLYPVTKNMDIYNQEQFGPVVPIATFKEHTEIHEYLINSSFGQQASIFATDPDEISQLVDVLVNQVSRINLNSQCQRGPDNFPFTGRKNSGAGTLSVHDALRVFSIRSLVACKETTANQEILSQITKKGSSNFLRMDHIF